MAPSREDEDKLKAYAAEHLKYDAMMLRATQELLMRPDLPDALNHTLLESFTLAVRRLMEFFYEEVGGDSDARATEYCAPGMWTKLKPKALWKIPGRINREIAHASLSRVDLTDETRTWNTGEIRRALELTFKDFLRVAYPDLLAARVRQELLEDGYATFGESIEITGVSVTNAGITETFSNFRGEMPLLSSKVILPDTKATSTSGLSQEALAQIHVPPATNLDSDH